MKQLDNMYFPLEGDIFTLETNISYRNFYQYNVKDWKQLANMSDKDVKALVSSMQFLGESIGYLKYYRPNQQDDNTLHMSEKPVKHVRIKSEGDTYKIFFHSRGEYIIEVRMHGIPHGIKKTIIHKSDI